MSNGNLQITENSQMQFIDSIDTNLVQKAVSKIQTIQTTLKAVLVSGKDYGTIPFCGDKPTLLKPGAEKIQMALGLLVEYELLNHTEDFDSGFFSYTIKARAKDNFGNCIAQGVGHANSKEKKQHTKTDNTEEKKRQTAIDKANTVLKMAKKRAQVDCILTVASLSEVFTQDLEDLNQNKPTGGENTVKKICTGCNAEISDKVAGFSQNSFGTPLCMDCQKKAKENKGA